MNKNLFKNLFAMVVEGRRTREVVLNISHNKYKRLFCVTLVDMDQVYLKMNDVEEVLLGGDWN